MDIELHEKQWLVFKHPARFKVVVCGRRWGKSRLQTAAIFMKALTYNRPINELTPETIVVAMPTLVMAKRVLWKPLVTMFSKVPGARINISDRRISVPGKPDVIVAGAENYDALRGLRIYYAAIDEFQDCPVNFLDSVIRPAMADTQGSSALITGTPKGVNNHFYDLAQSDYVKYFTFHTSTNPFIDKAEIEYARATLSPKLFQQEFEADWVNFGGAIYSEMSTHNLAQYSYDQSGPLIVFKGGQERNVLKVAQTFMGVDWGDVNPAYVVVAKTEGGTFYVLKARQIGDGSNAIPAQTFYDEVRKAAHFYNVQRVFCDPSRPSSIIDLRKIGGQYNLLGLKRAIKGDNSIVPGNSYVNNLFFQNRLFLPEYDKTFFDEMASYSRKAIRGTNSFYEDKIEDGQKDHKIDALRYCLFTLREKNKHAKVILG
jgi:hypothetical protein